MLEKLIDKYFNIYEKDSKNYYDVFYVKKVLEFTLNDSFDNIRECVLKCNINVTDEQIKAYLLNLFKSNQLSIQDSTNISNRTDNIDIYQYEPYTLRYYKNYTRICKSKALLLLSIIENISNNNMTSIKPLLNDLDIVIIDGKITKDDIIRIVDAFIYNLYFLETKVEIANDLRIYSYFKISKELLFEKGIDKSKIYPTVLLQVRNGDRVGNVRLSERQKMDLQKEKIKKNLKTFNVETH